MEATFSLISVNEIEFSTDKRFRGATKTTKDNPGVGYFDDSIYTEEYLSRLIRLSPPP